jgi:hypothetical protein
MNLKNMKRAIGITGTMARIVFGLVLVGAVVYGHIHGAFRPLQWVVGLIIFPLVFILWHRQQIKTRKSPFRKTGALAKCINIFIFLAFYFTYWYAPAIKFMSDAVLIYYGVSMLFAAVRGYGGCEVLAVSNWVLNRNDQLGCLLFKPFDLVDEKLKAGGHS